MRNEKQQYEQVDSYNYNQQASNVCSTTLSDEILSDLQYELNNFYEITYALNEKLDRLNYLNTVCDPTPSGGVQKEPETFFEKLNAIRLGFNNSNTKLRSALDNLNKII